jgi:hypothetical protein
MRRLMVLVTVVLLMTAMLVLTMTPASAVAGPPALLSRTTVGAGVPTVICEVTADDSGGLIGWRNGTCWVFHPVPVVSF